MLSVITLCPCQHHSLLISSGFTSALSTLLYLTTHYAQHSGQGQATNRQTVFCHSLQAGLDPEPSAVALTVLTQYQTHLFQGCLQVNLDPDTFGIHPDTFLTAHAPRLLPLLTGWPRTDTSCT